MSKPHYFIIDPLGSNSMKSSNPHSGFHESQVSLCLDTSMCNPIRNAGGGLVVHHKGVCEKSVLCYENHGQDSRVREIYCAPTIPQKAGTGGNNLPVVMRVKRRRADDDAEEGA